MKGIVANTVLWNKDTKTLLIKPERHVDFIPGQFMMVSLVVNEKLESRAFSLCNTPDEELLEITLKVIPDGRLSPKLFELNDGDEVILAGPYGNFRLNFDDKNAVLIAGGTGIAPLMSMIRYNKNHDWPMHLTVIYSAKNPEGILYRAELEGYHTEKKMDFIPISQDATALPEGFITGRITSDFIAKHVKNVSEQRFYLCGSPKMITEIEADLRKSGVDKDMIRTDKW